MALRRTLATATTLLLVGASAVNAALPPNYQRARELTAIIDAVASALEDHPVDSVSHVDGFVYEVIAGPCRITATIEPKPSEGIAGALQFTVALSRPACSD